MVGTAGSKVSWESSSKMTGASVVEVVAAIGRRLRSTILDGRLVDASADVASDV